MPAAVRLCVLIAALSFSSTSCDNTSSESSLQGATSTTSASAEKVADYPADFKFGKYGCTASEYNNGSITYKGRGFLEFAESGRYVYYGFENPSEGSFTMNEKGDFNLKGGYLDGARGEKIDRPDKFFMTFPANPDNRWTVSLIQ